MRGWPLLAILLAACAEAHFCASDLDCKGDRVCRRSSCEDPEIGDMAAVDLIPGACECNKGQDCDTAFGPTFNGETLYRSTEGAGVVGAYYQIKCNGTVRRCEVWMVRTGDADMLGHQSAADGGTCQP